MVMKRSWKVMEFEIGISGLEKSWKSEKNLFGSWESQNCF